MFSKFMEMQLLLSVKLDHSPVRIVRLFGALLGILPVFYAAKIEKKYSDEADSPGK